MILSRVIFLYYRSIFLYKIITSFVKEICFSEKNDTKSVD